MKRIPAGISDFQQMMSRGYLYSDKTELLYNLVREDEPYFLSRPRRFGKSLLVSTLENILRGRRELFKGLWIDGSDYDWAPRPVIKLSMDNARAKNVDLMNSRLASSLRRLFKKEKVDLCQSDDPPVMFYELAEELHARSDRKVAVLIDEYDAPITRNITKPALAEATLAALKDFYGVLKGASDHIGFIFVTGVTRFAHASIFSDLNNLRDLTLNRAYSGICGFTVDEFDGLFREHMETRLDEFISTGQLPAAATVDDLMSAILEYYDGYSWDGRTRVLNPWSVLNCLGDGELKYYWFKSGTPTFLVDLARERWSGFPPVGQEFVIGDEMNAVTMDRLDPVTLMFQSGYLTVKRADFDGTWKYHLGFPNLEVGAAMTPLLLGGGSLVGNPLSAVRAARAIRQCLLRRDADGFRRAWGSFIGHLPHTGQLPYEAYYHGVLTMALLFSGQELSSETAVAWGRLDIHLKALDTGDDYIIELKFLDVEVKGEGRSKRAEQLTAEEARKRTDDALRRALDQIEESRYTRKFQGGDNKIWKVAMVFRTGGDVAVAFDEASNWRLVEAADGRGYQVARIGSEPDAGG